MDTQYFRTTGTKVILGLALSLLLILMDGMGWVQPIYGAGSFIVEPVAYWTRQSVRAVNNVAGTIANIGELRDKNAELALEIARLTAEVGSCRETERENEVFRSQLGIELTQEWKLVRSRILGIDQYGTAEHVIIDAGSDDGVSNGDAVIIGDLLIGYIREIFPSTSRVRLVSNQESNIYAIDQNTGAKGLVHGTLEGVVMEEILESEDVKEGDIVVTWQDDIPGGLVLGLITRIVDIPTSSTKRAYLEPGFSLEDVQYVFVVTDY